MNDRVDSLARVAGGLALGAFALHFIALFPDYHQGEEPLTECCLTFNIIQMLVWPAAGVALLVFKTRLAGAGLLIGGTLALVSYMLSDVGTITGLDLDHEPGPGLWISVGLNASLIAGSIAAVAMMREHPTPRFATGASNVIFAIAGCLTGIVYAVGIALPSYKGSDGFNTVRISIFDSLEGVELAWQFVAMVIVIVLPLVGGFLRPLRIDGALLAGMTAVLWSEVVAAFEGLPPNVSTDVGVALRLAAAIVFTLLTLILASVGKDEPLEPDQESLFAPT